MDKLVNAIVAFILGTLAIGVAAATFYVFFTFEGGNADYIAYYGKSPVEAVLKFLIDPYHGDALVNDDVYIRNVIFGISGLIMGLLTYRQL